MIKAIIFDVDGTLLNTERIYVQSWKDAGASFGYTITDQLLLRTRAISKQLAIDILQEALGKDFPYDEIRKERVRISEEYIAAMTPEELCMPHASEVLQELASMHLPMAVASSSTYRETVNHLTFANLFHYFQAAVGGDMVEKGKPNPDIFLKAAKLLDVPAADCLVVGDTPADIQAALAANMPRILIPDLVAPNPQTRSLSLAVLDSLAQLPAQIQS